MKRRYCSGSHSDAVKSTGLVRRHPTLRFNFPYNMGTSIKRDQHSNSFFLNANQTYHFFLWWRQQLPIKLATNMQPQPPRVSPVGQLLQGGAIDPASSCRQHSMFLCYKSVAAQSLRMHCYAVFMSNSSHYQFYSTVLNHSKMNLFTDLVPTSQNTHYSFITKTNILFLEKNLCSLQISY